MKKILRPILYFAYLFSSLLIRPKTCHVTFLSEPDATDNSWFFYKYLNGLVSDYTLVWLVSNDSEDICNKIKNTRMGSANIIKIVKKNSLKGFYFLLRSKVVFFTHGTYFFIGNSFGQRVFVNLWHGMPIKKIAYMDGRERHQVPYCDYSISTSCYFRTIIAQSFGISEERVLNYGLPRNDLFLEHNGVAELRPDKSNIRNTLELSSQDKIVVWLPTYRVSGVGEIRQDSSSSSFLDEVPENFLEKLSGVAKDRGFSVLIKLHPLDHLNKTLSAMQGFEKVRLFSSDDWARLDIELYELLSVSDMLISDVSSVIVDYMLTGRKIAIVHSSVERYSRGYAFDIDKVVSSVDVIRAPEDILEILNAPEKSIENFEFFHSAAHQPSLSSQRIYDYFFVEDNLR
mgnify:CR=1 FL=1